MQRSKMRNTNPKNANENTMMPKQSNANEHQFIPVTGKKSKPKQHIKDLPTTGILLTRIGRRQDLEQKSVDMRNVLTAIHSIDPQAYVLPHNRDASQQIQIQAMLKQAQDYTTFMDMKLTQWGKPSENRSRIAFSFYVASEVILNVSAFKSSPQFQTMLSKYKLVLIPHNLLQMESKAIAYFLGKSPTHTW